MPNLGRDPREFIRHNLLRLDRALWNPTAAVTRADGTVLVSLVDVTGGQESVVRNRNRKGLARLVPRANKGWWTTAANLYAVRPAVAGDPDAFPAYICPYQQDRTNFKMLGEAADVMFTADMNGCTFGVGIPNPQGGVLVGHANEARRQVSRTDAALQRSTQLQNLTDGGAADRVLAPSAYYADPELVDRCITIGLRVGRRWEFYYQNHAGSPDEAEKLETTKLQ